MKIYDNSNWDTIYKHWYGCLAVQCRLCKRMFSLASDTFEVLREHALSHSEEVTV